MRSLNAILAVLAAVLAAGLVTADDPKFPGGVPGFGGLKAPPPAQAKEMFYDSRDRVRVSVIAQRDTVAPGGDTALAVIFDQQDGWHIHTHDPQVPAELGSAEDYIATAIHVTSSDPALEAHTNWIQWPEPHDFIVAFAGTPVPYAVYEGRAIAYVPITVSPDAKPGPVTLTVKPVFQACDDTSCLAPTPQPPDPGDEAGPRWTDYGWTLDLTIVPLSELATSTPSDDFTHFNGEVFGDIHAGKAAPDGDDVTFDAFGLSFGLDTDNTLGFILLLIVAALGGFLLNLTPCVLPVIPLKIMAISGASHSRLRTLMLGISMALGVIAFWIGIGLAIALLTGFTASNQLFQYPWFTIGIGVIIAAMAIGMCGLFAIRLPQSVYMVSPKHDRLGGSFLFGIMTAVLSTPCTAPFMGAAMAWAALEPPSVTLVTFAAIGIGMALPYLILAAFPKLTDGMPKAGPASELIKQVLGLLMLAAAAYFIGVGMSGLLAVPPEPPSRAYFWYVAAIVVAAGFWLAWSTWRLTKRGGMRMSMSLLGAFVAAAGIALAVALTDHGPIKWTWYTHERLEQAFKDDKVVVMEFTAEWCLNCKLLEEAVLDTEEVAGVLAEPDIEPIKVDLTGNNTAGNAMLHAAGRHQIPLLIVFAPDGTEVFKGDFYTADQVLDAIKTARDM